MAEPAPAQITPPLLVSIDEAARLLACSRTTLKVLIRRGEIRALKVGRLTRIPRRLLEEYVAATALVEPPRTVVELPRSRAGGRARNVRRR
jgi:excisionase family DNA binding protein